MPKRSKEISISGGCGAIIVIMALLFFPAVWTVMLVIGALSHVFPTAHWLYGISFWQSAIVTLALGILGSFFK